MTAKANLKIGIIGGSGLDNANIIANSKEYSVTTPFGDPSDKLICGTINGVECVLIARHGRKHTITPTNVNYRANIWALKEAKCTHILASSACGSLQEHIRPGDIVIPDTFVDLTKKRVLTFYDGTHFGEAVTHLPMKPAFCEKTRSIVQSAAKDLNLDFHSSGTVVVIEGPRFSSFAESMIFRSWGAHLVNMTLIPEAVLAKELGLCYAAIAVATDYDCWHETEQVVNVQDVLKVMKRSMENVINLMVATIKDISEEQWQDEIDGIQKLVQESHQNY